MGGAAIWKPLPRNFSSKLAYPAMGPAINEKIDVFCGPSRRCCRVGDEQGRNRSSNKDHFADQWPESPGYLLQHFNGFSHSYAPNHCERISMALPLSRARPLRIASTSTRYSYSLLSLLAAMGADLYSG